MGKNCDFIYYGLFLTDDSRNKLLKKVKRYADGLVPEDARLYLDHCTLLHCSKINGNEDLKQKLDFWIQSNHTKFDFNVTAIGRSDKAMAFMTDVNSDMCVNQNPHITIYTFNGGKPVDSNYITEWKTLDEPVHVDAELKKIS